MDAGSGRIRRTYARPVPRPTAPRPTWDDLLNIDVLPVTPAIPGTARTGRLPGEGSRGSCVLAAPQIPAFAGMTIGCAYLFKIPD